jgi:hypothetical protein
MKVKELNHYEKRNRVLREMGYRDYREYLKSDQWKEIRRRVLRPGLICECCQLAPANVIHHRKYDLGTLCGEDDFFLSPICDSCHDYAEVNDRGEKTGLNEANARLFSFAARRGHLMRGCCSICRSRNVSKHMHCCEKCVAEKRVIHGKGLIDLLDLKFISGPDGSYAVLCCPSCGFNYTHIIKQVYQADMASTLMWCEGCPYVFAVEIEFSKGNSWISLRSNVGAEFGIRSPSDGYSSKNI